MHVGDSSQSGHYICAVRHYRTGHWYHLDDGKAIVCDEPLSDGAILVRGQKFHLYLVGYTAQSSISREENRKFAEQLRKWERERLELLEVVRQRELVASSKRKANKK
jgi:Ubiquitin carboxyl-terminal hydrolase